MSELQGPHQTTQLALVHIKAEQSDELFCHRSQNIDLPAVRLYLAVQHSPNGIVPDI